MGVGLVIGALLGMGAGALGITVLGFTVGTMWMLGAALGSMYDATQFSMPTSTPNYSLDPVHNSLSGSIPVPVAYGRVRIAGNFFYQQFDDDTKDTMYVHCALSEGPISYVGIADVKVNDFATNELTTITREVFHGTPTQAAGTFDPEGIAYLNTAYVSLKMEASAKVGGQPVVTTVFNGVDVYWPGKEIAVEDTLHIGADATATGGFSKTTSLGYLSGLDTSKCIGKPTTTAYTSMTFYSDEYASSDINQIVCIPVYFAGRLPLDGWPDSFGWGRTRIKFYPDSMEPAYEILSERSNMSFENKFVTSLGANGIRLAWEPLRYGENSEYRAHSGIIQVFVPVALVTAGKKAKIIIDTTLTTNSLTAIKLVAGLLSYADCESDAYPYAFGEAQDYNNPAWCLYDFLTNTRYGAGIAESLIDVDSFATVAAQCAEEGISLNYIIDQSKPILDHLGDILAVFRGWMTVRETVFIGMDAPVLSPNALITDEDILVGSFSWWETPSDQVPNWVTVEYIDGDGEYDEGTWERMQVDAIDYDDCDSRGIVQSSFSLMGITNKAQAEAMAEYLLAKCLYGQTFCQFTTMLSRAYIEVGDVISITYDLPGWDEQWVRVVSITDGGDGTINVVCNVYDDNVYPA